MVSPTQIAFVAVAVSTMMSSPAMAQALPKEFTTALGETILLPPISEMECDEIDKVLTIIDETRYRENAPSPHDIADTPLYEYELLLAEDHYHRCVALQKGFGVGGLSDLSRSQEKK